MIVATHGHFDHIMAGFELQLNFNIPFLIHKKDEFLLNKMRSSVKYFLGRESGPPPKITKYLSKKDSLKVGMYKLSLLETPGHTPGGVCFYSPKEKIIFCGDLFFAGGGIGRTDFSYSDPAKLELSLKKVFKLPGETRVFPGHGKETTISQEKQLLDLS